VCAQTWRNAARATAACALLTIALSATASAAWNEPIPGPVSPSGDPDASFPSFALVAGVPYVAWQRSGGGGSEIHVARLSATGTAWEAVGGSLTAANAGGAQPSIADIGGVPHVAFMESDDDGDFQIHVARLAADGTTWERIGETADPAKPINESASRDAFAPSLASIAGVPFVAWRELDGTNSEIRVARLNGGGAGWDKVGQTLSPASPINQLASADAFEPSLTAVGSVPHVAWREFDGGNFEIRVARLNAAGTGWDKVGQTLNPSSPVNQSGGGDAREPSLSAIGGVPFVAWREAPIGGTFQTRVARLNGADTGWDKVAGGLSPINKSSDGQATDPSLLGIGGVPYVSWSEASPTEDALWVARLNSGGSAWEMVPDSVSPVASDVGLADPSLIAANGIPWVAFKGGTGANIEIHASRLEPEFDAAAAPSATGATLIAAVRAFDLPYQVGFQLGPGLVAETPTQQTAGETDLVTATVTGLSPSTTVPFRAFAIAGVPAPLVFGATKQFTTLAAAQQPPPGPANPDAQPPKLELGGKQRQKLARTIRVAVSCTNEACDAEASGTLVVRREASTKDKAAQRFSLKEASASIAAGGTATLRLGLARRARAAATASLKAGGAVRAKLSVAARDAAGNSTTARRTVGLAAR
jgi:hypothetical protein